MHHFFAAKNKQIEAERRATEARLRLLQAQMEPHFLFNTLANVQGLVDQQPAKAKQMLESFTDYLRATLTQLRSDDSTVGAELDLADVYLQLLATRMEDRLHFEIHADEAARRQKLPPLLLQPLVENAIHHGLEPKLEGGTVRLQACVQDGQLRLEVRDDGMGPAAAARRGRKGAGVALANLRERLLSRYGSDARFEIENADPGTVARITLPITNA
jgi:sensor histidine kinase YesM